MDFYNDKKDTANRAISGDHLSSASNGYCPWYHNPQFIYRPSFSCTQCQLRKIFLWTSTKQTRYGKSCHIRGPPFCTVQRLLSVVPQSPAHIQTKFLLNTRSVTLDILVNFCNDKKRYGKSCHIRGPPFFIRVQRLFSVVPQSQAHIKFLLYTRSVTLDILVDVYNDKKDMANHAISGDHLQHPTTTLRGTTIPGSYTDQVSLVYKIN